MKKKILCGLLCAAMMAGTLVSCGNSGSSSGNSGSTGGDSTSSSAEGGSEGGDASVDRSKSYEVNFVYLVAQEGTDYQAIRDKASELSTEAVNCTVNLIPTTYGTLNNTVNMMLPASEPLDWFTGWGSGHSTNMSSGYIRDINEYAEYLPNITEWLGDQKTACEINGQWVVIPSNFERVAWLCYLIRNDIFEEMGYSYDDFEGIDIDDWSSWDKLTDLFLAVKEAHPEMTVLAGTMNPAYSGGGKYWDPLSDSFGVLMNYGQSTTVENLFETDVFYKLCEISKNWYDKGIYNADIATSTDSIEPILKAGNTCAGCCNAKPNTIAEKKSQCAQDVGVINVSKTMLSNANFGSGFCLASASKDPVRAADWYNWMWNDTEFQDLLNWGLEGRDYVVGDDGLAHFPEGMDANSADFHSDYGWILPNQMAGHPWEGNDVNVWDQYTDFNKGDYVSKGFDLVWDNTNVLDQVLACTSIWQEYYQRVTYGATDDLQSTIDEMNQKLYDAGLQDIIDEKQKQLDAVLNG